MSARCSCRAGPGRRTTRKGTQAVLTPHPGPTAIELAEFVTEIDVQAKAATTPSPCRRTPKPRGSSRRVRAGASVLECDDESAKSPLWLRQRTPSRLGFHETDYWVRGVAVPLVRIPNCRQSINFAHGDSTEGAGIRHSRLWSFSLSRFLRGRRLSRFCKRSFQVTRSASRTIRGDIFEVP